MPEPQPPAATYPVELLVEYLRRLGDAGDPLAAVLQARSADARAIFTAAATGRCPGRTAAPGPSLATASTARDTARLVDGLCARLSNPATARRLDPEALGNLARVLALQDFHPDDATAAMALLDATLARFGPRRIAAAHQGFHAQLALHLGCRERAAGLLRAYRGMPETVRANLVLDLANPFNGGSEEIASWLDRFRALLPPARFSVADGTAPPIDRLRALPDLRSTAGRRITTIVTTFRPGDPLVTAVRSLVSQSWTNHEVLVVDDGSPPEFDAVLRRCIELDPRIRLLKLPANAGTYVARNAGLDAATGEFVTFQDSDDWSHPHRLEHQVKPLLADPGLVCTTSVGMRIGENLVVTRLGWEDHRSYNLSSMMFRRDAALRRLGYLDVVRKGADAEYLERARAAFGRRAVRHLTGSPYALIRLSPHSLSGADIRFGWLHPARRAYLSAFMAWHRRIAAGESDPRRPRHPESRPFPAPRHLSATTSARTARYDVVLAGDWTAAGCAPATTAAGQIQALRRRNLRIGVLHLDVLVNLAGGWQYLDTAVQDLINDGAADPVVLSDPVEASLVVVRNPTTLLFPPSVDSQLRAARVIIQAGRPPHDGTRPRYAPAVCATNARRLFGAEPLWCPSGPPVRGALDGHPDRPRLADVDLWETVQVERWRVHRTRLCSDRPVLGHVLGDDGGRPVDRRALVRVFGASTGLDVRLFDSTGDALRDGPPLPGGWLLYGRDDVSARGFLHQLDFYVHAPDGGEAGIEPAARAMAAGCVVLLPPTYAGTFGNAAVYCEPGRVRRVVRRYHAAPTEFLAQSRRAAQHALRHRDHDAYAEKITTILGLSGGK